MREINISDTRAEYDETLKIILAWMNRMKISHIELYNTMKPQAWDVVEETTALVVRDENTEFYSRDKESGLFCRGTIIRKDGKIL